MLLDYPASLNVVPFVLLGADMVNVIEKLAMNSGGSSMRDYTICYLLIMQLGRWSDRTAVSIEH